MKGKTKFHQKKNKFRIFLRKSGKPFLQEARWFIIVGLAIFTFFLGYAGFEKSFIASGNPQSSLDLAYLSFQLFIFQSGFGYVMPVGWELEWARFLAPALTFSTLIVFLFILFYKQFREFCLRFVDNHVVICGIGLLGPILARQFYDLGYRVVVIENDPTNEEIEKCREYGAYVLIGDATDTERLKKARVQKASYLIAVLGDDGLNAELIGRTHELIKEKENSHRLLSSFAHIVDPSIFGFMKAQEIGSHIPDRFRLEFINLYQTAGQYILQDYPPFDPDFPDPPETHLLVIGVGRMGESLIEHACKQWRDRYGASGKKLVISIIDLDMRKKEHLLIRYPSLSRYCQLHGLQMEVRSPEFLKGEYLLDNNGNVDITQIYICIGDDDLSLSTALFLHQKIGSFRIPIIVRTNNDRGIATLFKDGHRGASEKFSNIHVFPLVGEECHMDYILNSTHERIAKAIHEDYYRSMRENGEDPTKFPAMRPWDDLSEYYKEENRKLADSYIEKLKSVKCNIDPLLDWDESPIVFSEEEIDKMARIEHKRWMDSKNEAGWEWGEKRDDKRKKHPSLVEWEDLPESEKEKDRAIVRNIPDVLRSVDLKVIRIE